jgi:hypothetical protein
MRYVDQLESSFMHGWLELAIAPPVAVGLLDHDVALEQQSFEHLLNIEGLVACIAHPESNVFEIAEQGEITGRIVGHDCPLD